MNLDLLIKLARLANNNPNDNEANSAARRACKLIAEGNYQFTELTTKDGRPIKQGPKVDIRPPGRYQPASNPPPRTYPEDYFRNMGWSGFKSAGEQQQRGPSWYDERYDPTKTSADYDAETRRRRQQNVYEPGMGFSGEKPQKPKIRRTCSKCTLDVETNNTKEPFICTVCQWKDYMEKG